MFTVDVKQQCNNNKFTHVQIGLTDQPMHSCCLVKFLYMEPFVTVPAYVKLRCILTPYDIFSKGSLFGQFYTPSKTGRIMSWPPFAGPSVRRVCSVTLIPFKVLL